jgi:hypothetical protein
MILLSAPGARAMRRDQLDGHRLSRLLGVREIWVNLGHANTRLAASMASVAPSIAAFALLQAAFAHWEGLSEARFTRIRMAAAS